MAYKTISVKSFVPVRDEALANAAITPGHLIERMSTGKVKVHATSGGIIKGAYFALEDELQGAEIGTAYDAGDLVQFNHFRPGDRVYAILEDGQTVVIGDALESSGSGTLIKHTADISDSPNVANQLVGVALEAVDLSASSNLTADARVLIEII